MPTYVCALHFSPFFVEKQNIPLRHQGASGAGNQCYQIWRILLVIHRTTKLVNCYCNAVTLDKKGLNDSLVKYPQILKNGCKKKILVQYCIGAGLRAQGISHPVNVCVLLRGQGAQMLTLHVENQ